MSSANSPFDRAGLMVLCAASFLSMVSMRLCDPLLPAFSSDFGISTGDAALTVSSFAVAYGLCQLLFGPLGDRYGKFRVISVAVAACTLGNACAVLTDSWNALIFARCLSGATAGGIIPLTLAWVGDSVSYQRRQEVLGQVMVATLLGISFGQWMAGAFADSVGWRWAFAVTTFGFVLMGITMLRMSAVRKTQGLSESADIPYVSKVRKVLCEPWARWILLLTAIEGAFAFSGMIFIPAFLHEAHGLSLRHAALVTALFAAGGLLYALIARHMVSLLGEKGLAWGGALMMGIGLLMLVTLPSWHWAMPVCLAAGMGFTMLHATLQTHATQMAPLFRGTATALFGACIFLGQSLGVLLAGAGIDAFGMKVVFLVAGPVIAVIGLVFAWSIARYEARQAIALV